jgi:hypothetical protein
MYSAPIVASGRVGAWVAGGAPATYRAAPTLVAVHDRLYLLGGGSQFGGLIDDVEAAPIVNGVVGAFAPAGRLAVARGAFTDGASIWASAPSGGLQRAPLLAGGALGPAVADASLPVTDVYMLLQNGSHVVAKGTSFGTTWTTALGGAQLSWASAGTTSSGVVALTRSALVLYEGPSRYSAATIAARAVLPGGGLGGEVQLATVGTGYFGSDPATYGTFGAAGDHLYASNTQRSGQLQSFTVAP